MSGWGDFPATRRCGTCWTVLEDHETVEGHAETSRWHGWLVSGLSYEEELRSDAMREDAAFGGST